MPASASRSSDCPLPATPATATITAGGLATAVLVAVGLNRAGLLVHSDTKVFLGGDGVTDLIAVGFGLTMGVAGVLGDLAESLIKREGGQKDASQAIPGFGGLLDVIDSVIFAAPVAFCWLRFCHVPPGGG